VRYWTFGESVTRTGSLQAVCLDGTVGLISEDPDIAALGRFVVTKNPKDIGSFKTPNLRNVALTGHARRQHWHTRHPTTSGSSHLLVGMLLGVSARKRNQNSLKFPVFSA
jgi:hypothetical protein